MKSQNKQVATPSVDEVVLNSSFDAIIITDTNLKIKSWNKAAERIYGWAAEEVIGKEASLLRTEFLNNGSKDVALERLLESGSYEDEVLQYTKDGRPLNILSAVKKVKSCSGEFDILAINRDITPQKSALDKLSNANAKFKKLFEESAIAKAITRVQDGKVLEVNRGFLQLFGYENKSDVIGRLAVELGFHSSTGQRDEFISDLKKGVVRDIDRLIPGPEQKERWINISVGFIEWEGEECTICHLRDISEKKEAERQTKKFSEIVNNIPLSIAVFRFEDLSDPASLRLVSVNPASENTSVAMKRSFVGKLVKDFSPVTISSGRAQQYLDLVKSGGSADMGIIFSPRGTQLAYGYFHEIAFALPDQSLCLTIEDVTERIASEEKTRKLNMQLLDAQRIASIGSWEWKISSNEITWSDELYRIYGVEKETFEASFANFMQLVHPEDRDHLRKVIDESVQKQTSYSVRHRIIRKCDGVVRMLQGRGSVVKDLNGNVVALSGTGQDITEHVEREEELHRTKETFRTLLESAPDAVVIVNEQGKVVVVNAQAEKIFGYNREELYGNSVDMLIPERLTAHVNYRTGYLMSNSAQNQVQVRELYGRRKDGTEFPVEVSLSPMHSHEGAWVISSIRDVTQRKKTENELLARTQELQRSNKELEEFAYVASHDLQEPLRNITNYVTLFQKYHADKFDGDTKVYLDFIVGSAGRMKTLITELLNFSRIGKNIVRNELIDCNAVMQIISRELELQISESGANIEWSDLPQLQGNPSDFRQLFQNLISNAIKFRKPDVQPLIQVKHSLTESEHVFCVSDNGIGIEERFYNKIFLIFQRLHTNSQYPGTGIGLAACKKIVDIYKGRLWVESVAGQGSSFYFTIPFAAQK